MSILKSTGGAMSALFVLCCLSWLGSSAAAQESNAVRLRGSLVEDRAARKLLAAGDARYEANEVKESLEVWKSVIERYPRSRVRFEAHMRLGNYYLERDRAYDRARAFFEGVLVEENRDEQQKAEATLKVGICFYQAGIYGKCFQIMRDVIEKYPVSPQVNKAYHYIGLGHFQLGHYSRAIEALEKVGTALESQEGEGEKVEAGKRLFVKIDDADLAALEAGEIVKVSVEATSGDKETVSCFPVGRNVRVVLGTISTQLGRPHAGNGTLEVKGDDKVKVIYIDQHTADKQVDQKVLKEVDVVGNANASVTDGAFNETLRGVVLGKPVNIQVNDPDRDLSDEADMLSVKVDVYRPKTEEELETEVAELAAKEEVKKPDDTPVADIDYTEQVERFKRIDGVELKLVEAKIERRLTSIEVGGEPTEDSSESESPDPDAAAPSAKETDAGEAETEDAGEEPSIDQLSDKKEEPSDKEEGAESAKSGEKKPGEKKPAGKKPSEKTEDAARKAPEKTAPPMIDNSIHSGVFRGTVSLVRAEEIVPDDDVLQALPGDEIRVVYLDERNMSEGINEVRAVARCIEGDLGVPRVTRAVIQDEELRLQTKLKTASALTNIGNRYKEFGLKASADDKYEQALEVCDEIMADARRLGGRILEETYVQLWKIYFEMDQLNLAAAMAQRLQNEFPTSGFVDEAMLQLGNVAREQGDYQRAIGIYSKLVAMKKSELRGEAQFGIAECYEAMAEAAGENQQTAMFDRAFQEYKKVFDQYPESGRVGEAVAKMANYYYKQKDYSRAVDTFETVLSEHPDAKFLDVVLFNYGRCLYRMGRRAEARKRFDQLIGDYPQSALAGDAKKISDALRKAGL